MGYYINTKRDGTYLEAGNKADQLIADGATEVPTPEVFQENLVCVVENGVFDAAAFIYDAGEMAEFLPSKRDTRKRRWLIVPDAAALAHFPTRKV